MITLSPVSQRFVLHWGEMGTRWGVNRTVAQIHALLFLSPDPLNAEEIAETLDVARSNVSNSLHELQGWGIVKIVHVKGDRRDHFESMKDIWEMFRVIMNERKRREIDPTVSMLKECLAKAQKAGAGEVETKKRLSELLDFFESATVCYEQMRHLPAPALMKFVKAGDKVRKVLGLD